MQRGGTIKRKPVKDWLKEKLPHRAVLEIATLAGIMKGIGDIFVKIGEMGRGAIDSIARGNVLKDLKNIATISYHIIMETGWDDLKNAFEHFTNNWSKKINSPDPWEAGFAQGYLVGNLVGEVLMAYMTAGAASSLKGGVWGTKLGKTLKESKKLREFAKKAKKIGRLKLPKQWKILLKRIKKSKEIKEFGTWKKAPKIENDVIVYHGSRHNKGDILKEGLSKKIPTNASRQMDAAEDAMHNYYRNRPTDFGLIESKIPKDIWNKLVEKGHIFERSYRGFSGKLKSTELRFNSELAIDVFNLGIIKKIRVK